MILPVVAVTQIGLTALVMLLEVVRLGIEDKQEVVILRAVVLLHAAIAIVPVTVLVIGQIKTVERVVVP